VINQLFLSDYLTGAFGKMDQNIERPAAERKHLPVTPQHSLPDR